MKSNYASNKAKPKIMEGVRLNFNAKNMKELGNLWQNKNL